MAQDELGLQTLDLSYNRIGPEGAKHLSEALKTNSALQTLFLKSNNLAGETGYVLATKVQGDSTEVGAKVLYDKREMIVSTSFEFEHIIKMIDLSGVVALSGALKTNSAPHSVLGTTSVGGRSGGGKTPL